MALVPNFSGTPLSGYPPLTVAFTDLTTDGTPSSWLWNFGDSSTSTLQNPTHVYSTPGLKTVSLTVTEAAVVGDLNAIVWDGAKFVIVGDNGIVMTTPDGSSPVIRSVPAGVSTYKLTGVEYNSGVYVAVGTKTIGANSYRLLILTSLDGISWSIDSEVDFSSTVNPAVAWITVFYGNSEFVINGSLLNVIRGVPGAWSSAISLGSYYTSQPAQDVMFKDGNYYASVNFPSCAGGETYATQFNTSFVNVSGDTLIFWPTGGDSARGVLLFDYTTNKWVLSYHGYGSHYIRTANNWNGPWTEVVNVSMPTKKSRRGKYFSALGRTYIVGGDGITGGLIYRSNGGSWLDITSGQVSLNDVAYSGSIMLAVGYQGAITVITTP